MRLFLANICGAFVLMLTTAAYSQHARFSTEGSIEFEKSVNMHAQIQRMMTKDNELYYNPMFDQYKKTQQQFKTIQSTLSYSKTKTLYAPVEVETPTRFMFSDIPALTQANVIYTDLSANKFTANKKVFEEQFLVTDSVRKINWKLTSETRDIAGYTCRRANAVIMDSIYVVAFYTDEIPVSGGPESFAGLPGMILGVALPHENITWFAKMVHDKALPPNTIIPPKKGKVTNVKGMETTLLGALKSWGDYARGYMKVFML